MRGQRHGIYLPYFRYGPGASEPVKKAGQKAEGQPPLLPSYRNESREYRASAGDRAAGGRTDGRAEADGRGAAGRSGGRGRGGCWASSTKRTSWTDCRGG